MSKGMEEFKPFANKMKSDLKEDPKEFLRDLMALIDWHAAYLRIEAAATRHLNQILLFWAALMAGISGFVVVIAVPNLGGLMESMGYVFGYMGLYTVLVDLLLGSIFIFALIVGISNIYQNE